MAGIGLDSGFAAGAGADMLQEILKRKAAEAFQQQQLAQQAEQMRQQEADRAAQRDYQTKVFTTQEADRQQALKDREAADKEKAAQKTVDQQTAAEGKFQGRLKLLPKGAIIDAAGAADFNKFGAAPLLKPRTSVQRDPNRDPTFMGPTQDMEPKPTGDFEYTGTQADADAEATRGLREQLSQAQIDAANQRAAAAASGRRDRFSVATVPDPKDPSKNITVRINTDTGEASPVSLGGSTMAGKSSANATIATRVASAETVNQVGSDLIRKLSDPAFARTVGPAMGRVSKLSDFIGNPPPEFSELAGQIESYALANMGVHGMRSAQGAEMIKKLLEQHHTPESLAATIRGLNDFSTRFVQNNKPGATAVAPATKAAPNMIGRFEIIPK